MKKIFLSSTLILGIAYIPSAFSSDFDDAVRKLEDAFAGRKYSIVEKQSQDMLKQAADDSQKARLYDLLGDSLEKQKKTPEALKAYTTAFELAKNPDAKKAYSLKTADMILKNKAYERYPEMIRFLSDALAGAKTQEEKTELTMRLADAKLNGQYLEDAVSLLRGLVKDSKVSAADRFEAQLTIGNFYSAPVLQRSSDPRRSLNEYQAALQMPGVSAEQQFRARRCIASTYAECNEYRPAIAAYLEAARLQGVSPELKVEAYTSAAKCALDIRDITGAMQIYKECAEIPGIPAKEKAVVLGKTADAMLVSVRYDDPPSPENVREAIKIYESIIALSKENEVSATKRIAEIQYQSGNYRAALKTLEKLSGPKANDEILILCGDCELAMNNIPGARKYYEQAFAMPNLPHKRNNAAQHLVKILVSQEDYNTAISVLAEVKEAYPANHKQQKDLADQIKQLRQMSKPSGDNGK